MINIITSSTAENILRQLYDRTRSNDESFYRDFLTTKDFALQKAAFRTIALPRQSNGMETKWIEMAYTFLAFDRLLWVWSSVSSQGPLTTPRQIPHELFPKIDERGRAHAQTLESWPGLVSHYVQSRAIPVIVSPPSRDGPEAMPVGHGETSSDPVDHAFDPAVNSSINASSSLLNTRSPATDPSVDNVVSPASAASQTVSIKWDIRSALLSVLPGVHGLLSEKHVANVQSNILFAALALLSFLLVRFFLHVIHHKWFPTVYV